MVAYVETHGRVSQPPPYHYYRVYLRRIEPISKNQKSEIMSLTKSQEKIVKNEFDKILADTDPKRLYELLRNMSVTLLDEDPIGREELKFLEKLKGLFFKLGNRVGE